MYVNEVSCVSLFGRFVLLPRDLSHHLTQNDTAKASIYRDLAQSEVGNAALYRDLVQIESDNVGVYLHVLVRCADLKPPYIKAQEISLSAVHLWAVSEGVLAIKRCGSSVETLRNFSEISRQISATTLSRTTP